MDGGWDQWPDDEHDSEQLGTPDFDSGTGLDADFDAGFDSAETVDLGYGDEPASEPSPVDGPDTFPDPDTTPLPQPLSTMEAMVGIDPDASPHDWTGGEFPPALDLGPLPDPIDGPPWTDPALLGDTPLPAAEASWPAPDPGDLFDYAGLPPLGHDPSTLDLLSSDPWSTLRASGDPATSALAHFWAPAQR